MTSPDSRPPPKPPDEERRVFPTVPTLDAREIGVTLETDDETVRKLDQIQEEAIKAAQEHQKFAWR